MIKLILAFFIVFAFFFIGLKMVRSMSNKEKWNLTKLAIYSILCSVLTISTLTFIVFIF